MTWKRICFYQQGKFSDEDYDVLMLTLSENLSDVSGKARTDKKRTKKAISGQERVETLFVSRDAEGRSQEGAPAPDRQVIITSNSARDERLLLPSKPLTSTLMTQLGRF